MVVAYILKFVRLNDAFKSYSQSVPSERKRLLVLWFSISDTPCSAVSDFD